MAVSNKQPTNQFEWDMKFFKPYQGAKKRKQVVFSAMSRKRFAATDEMVTPTVSYHIFINIYFKYFVCLST